MARAGQGAREARVQSSAASRRRTTGAAAASESRRAAPREREEPDVAPTKNAAPPHLRQELVDGKLHRYRCAGCGGELVVEKKLLYFAPRGGSSSCTCPGRRWRARRRASQWCASSTTRASAPPRRCKKWARDEGAAVLRPVGACEKALADEAGLNDLALEAGRARYSASCPSSSTAARRDCGSCRAARQRCASPPRSTARPVCGGAARDLRGRGGAGREQLQRLLPGSSRSRT